MKAQRGAALVMVLVLLASTAMIATSAMHASLLENKQSGSYRAAVLVQMASEGAAAKLINDPAHSALASCAGQRDWVKFDAFSPAHSAVQLACRQCTQRLAGYCPGHGDTRDVTIEGASFEYSVTATVLLRGQLVDQARARTVASRTLVITRLYRAADGTTTLRWHAL